MDFLNRKKVKDLESFLDVYRERNKQLEDQIKILEDYKLKYKIAQMLVDDDPAIDELLTAHKEKDAALRVTDIIDDREPSRFSWEDPRIATCVAMEMGRGWRQWEQATASRQAEMSMNMQQGQLTSQLQNHQNQMESDLQRQRQMNGSIFGPWLY